VLKTSAVFVTPTLKQRRANPGQVIVLPRAHIVGLPNAEPALLGELFTVVARIATAAPAVFGAVGTTTFNNNSAPDQDLEHCTSMSSPATMATSSSSPTSRNKPPLATSERRSRHAYATR